MNTKTNLPWYYFLDCPVQHYDWGNRSESGIIRLLSPHISPPGSDTPFAELWMGAHPTAPARIKEHPHTLEEAIRENPSHFLGSHLLKTGVRTLPFLFKVLDAERPLSIQAHPDRELAGRLHQEDPDHYPDANHKPEVAVCLKGMSALVGFRSQNEIRSTLQMYPELAALCGLEEANARRRSIDWIRSLYSRLMKTPHSLMEMTVEAHSRRLSQKSEELSGEDALYLQLVELFGKRDPGVFSPYMLNILHLLPGEALFLGPNEPHAYLSGEIIECMAASDNVVRAGLTGKFCDVETLLSMLHYSMGPPPILRPRYTPSLKRERYSLPVDEFSLFRIPLRKGDPVLMEDISRPTILLVMEGSLDISAEDEEGALPEQVTLTRGSVLFLPGDLRERSIRITLLPGTEGEIYGASTGDTP